MAYRFIRKRILKGDYLPGEALMTKNLSAEIGVSRTPVRDALRQLEADGLVLIQAHLGASVKRFDFKEFKEACALRLALETHAAGLAALNRTEVDLQEMAGALEAMQQHTTRLESADAEEELLKELVNADIRFHIAIMTAAKNEMMKKEILRLHLINRVVSGPPPDDKNRHGPHQKLHRDERRRNVVQCHRDIYHAIAAGDAPTAKATMEAHIQEMIDSSLRRVRTAAISPRELTEDELIYRA